MPTDPVYNPHIPSASGADSSPSSWSGSATSSSSLSSVDESGISWSSLAAGLCAGACVGAGLALIYAPMRGSELRSSVRSYAAQGGERLSNLMESGRSIAEDAFSRASSLMEQGRHAFRTGSGITDSSTVRSSASSPQPLTASVADISGRDRRFEEPLGG
jgi:gas vesicle protein